MTTGSEGRSPGPVAVLAIASTTPLGVRVDDLAEDGVLAVQVRGLAYRDEELRAVGSRARVGHRQQVGLVELQLGVELVGELVARAAAAGAGGVAALDHEAADDPVEDHAVVERAGAAAGGVLGRVLLGALGQAHEVGDGLGGVVAEQRDFDVAAVGVQGGSGGMNRAGSHGITVCHHRPSRRTSGARSRVAV